MINVFCTSNRASINNLPPSTVRVLLYGTRSENPNGASIGSQVKDEIARFGVPVPQRVFDFLTVALAVTAADTFVRRDEAADGWSREIELTVAVGEPDIWYPHIGKLEKALLFLSGDIWKIKIEGGGLKAPSPYTNSRARLISVKERDCICLFSGGLDSTVGALNLLAQGKRPILVSHSYRGDKAAQECVVLQLTGEYSRFAAVANPVWSARASDSSMRTRSLNFLAYGIVAASVLESVNNLEVPILYVPENGFISLNVPLTSRRIGSHSTRTTHPHFLTMIQQLVNDLDIHVRINNPYQFKTKGEMLKDCVNLAILRKVANQTVSCGKWKRTGQQCGRCVPCIIRRAAFWKSGISDNTDYRFIDLSAILADENERDDLLALMLAILKLKEKDVRAWVSSAGPLPEDGAQRKEYYNVFSRGLDEVKGYLRNSGLLS